jgi:hypothetical protein
VIGILEVVYLVVVGCVGIVVGGVGVFRSEGLLDFDGVLEVVHVIVVGDVSVF